MKTFASELREQIKKDQVALSQGATKSDLLKRCERVAVKEAVKESFNEELENE